MLITIFTNYQLFFWYFGYLKIEVLKGCVGGDNSLQHILVTDVTCLCWVQISHVFCDYTQT